MERHPARLWYASAACIALIGVICGHSLPAFGQTGSSMLYLPLLQASNSGELGLALSNPTLSDATVVLTARSYTGLPISGPNITNPVTWSLSSSSQKAQLAAEIFGPGIVDQRGWVEIQSSDSVVRGFYLLFDSSVSYIDGADLANVGTRTLVFPKVITTPTTATNVSFVNVSSSTNQAAISLFDNGGSLVFYKTFTLDPKSGFSGPITDLIPEIGMIAFEGYAVLETSSGMAATQLQSLVGFESYRNKSDIAVVTGIPSNKAMRTGYVAHMATGGGYRSTLTMVNYSAQSQTVRITAEALQRSGQSLIPSSVSVDRTIDSFGRMESEIGTLFNISSSELTIGYIRFQVLGDTTGLISVLDYGTTDGVLLSTVPAQAEGFSDLLFSQVAEGNGYYTGLALLNPNNQPALVGIDVFTKEGEKTASAALLLAAGERRSRLLKELAPSLADQNDGYIRINSTRPVLAFELFGSSNSLRFLANVSALGSLMQPQESGSMVDASQGATVISSDGTVSLSIPPTAVNSNVPVSVTPLDTTTLPEPAGRTLVAAVEATPAGLTFRIPVAVTFPLSVQLAAGTLLPVLVLNPATNVFVPAGNDAVVDESGRNAVATITHFSKYAVDVAKTQLLTVTSIDPPSGFPGTMVTITGSGFDPNPDKNTVTFAGSTNAALRATVVTGTATTVSVVVPTGAVSGDVIVTSRGLSSVGVPFIVPTTANSPNSPPSVTSLSPPSAMVGAASMDIVIRGTGFLGSSTVKFDGIAVASSFVNATRLSIHLSASQLTPMIHDVVVSNPSPGGDSNPIEFPVVYPLPVITDLNPNSAVAGSTQTVTITGSGFTTNSVVFVKGVVTPATFVNATSMTVRVTSAVAVVIPVSVSNPSPGGGLSNAADFTFTQTANGRPSVTASGSPSVTMPAAATLSGTATDDGYPAALTTTWTKFSGVGTVTFQNPKALNTTATFSAGGIYVLRLTASDTLLRASADVTVRVTGSIPPVTVSNPAAGFVRGSVNVALSTVSDAGLTSVQFRLNGSNLGSPVIGTGPYATPWSTVGLADGSQHTLSAIATDGVGNQTVAANVLVRVDNTPPTVAMTAPAGSAKVRGVVQITANASDAGSSVAKVQFRVDGSNAGTPVAGSGPFSLSWNSALVGDGSHTLSAVATDAAGNQTTATGVVVSVDNTGPTGVAITAPIANAVTSGVVALRSNAADTSGIVKVEFRVDNNLVGTDTTNATQPFSVSWDSTTVIDGAHSVKATAFDAFGNQAASPSVSFVVTNSSGAPSVRQFFASPTGLPGGDGSMANPWPLAIALCGGPNSKLCGGGAAPQVQPGDTLWLRGGIYYGTFRSKLAGTPGNPVTVRSYPGEWAKVDAYLTTALTSSPSNATTDCSFTLANAAGFQASSVVHIGAEQVYFIRLSGNTVTGCLRGYNGTPVIAHSAGEKIALTGQVLVVDGTDAIYRDFEITNSNPNRVFLVAGDASNQRGGDGILVYGSRTKYINLIVHDAEDGLFFALGSQDTEVNGVILYNNGHVDPVRGHGHGIYIQNQNGVKTFKDVISFNNYASGMKAFGVNAYANNVEFDGVISFNNGSPASFVGTPALASWSDPNSGPISPTFRHTNLFVGTEVNPPQNIVMTNNYLYHSPNTTVSLGTMGLGYTSVNGNNFKIDNNYVIGGHLALYVTGIQNSSITNNVFLARPRPGQLNEALLVEAGFQNPGSINFANNTYYNLNTAPVAFSLRSSAIPGCCRNRLGGGLLDFSDTTVGISGNSAGSGWVQWTGFDKTSAYSQGSLPTTNAVFVRPNQYEAGRAHIAVYNWQNLMSVSVDLSSTGLVTGDAFEIRDVQNYFGTPVVTAVYDAGSPFVQIPMGDSSSTVASPTGAPFTPSHTNREFGAFVVKKY